MKQKTCNPYYKVLQAVDLAKWYHLNPNVLGEPEWNLNSMDYLGDKLENEVGLHFCVHYNVQPQIYLFTSLFCSFE